MRENVTPQKIGSVKAALDKASKTAAKCGTRAKERGSKQQHHCALVSAIVAVFAT